MTRTAKTPPPKPPRPPGRWLLQDAKARFSELVRRVRSEGPQHVTVHGRDEVVVVSAEEFRRLKGEHTGDTLIAAMQALPYRDSTSNRGRARMPVRGVDCDGMAARYKCSFRAAPAEARTQRFSPSLVRIR